MGPRLPFLLLAAALLASCMPADTPFPGPGEPDADPPAGFPGPDDDDED